MIQWQRFRLQHFPARAVCHGMDSNDSEREPPVAGMDHRADGSFGMDTTPPADQPRLREWYEDLALWAKSPAVRFWLIYGAIGLAAWLIFGVVVPRAHEAQCLAQAKQNLHSVQLALERYAVDAPGSQYPADMNVLIKEGYLNAMPDNPFTGKPMQWRRPGEPCAHGDFVYEWRDNGEGYSLILY